ADRLLICRSWQLAASPSPRLRGEGRGEGRFEMLRILTRGETPSPGSRYARSDLSPQAGRGDTTIWSRLLRALEAELAHECAPLFGLGLDVGLDTFHRRRIDRNEPDVQDLLLHV